MAGENENLKKVFGRTDFLLGKCKEAGLPREYLDIHKNKVKELYRMQDAPRFLENYNKQLENLLADINHYAEMVQASNFLMRPPLIKQGQFINSVFDQEGFMEGSYRDMLSRELPGIKDEYEIKKSFLKGRSNQGREAWEAIKELEQIPEQKQEARQLLSDFNQWSDKKDAVIRTKCASGSELRKAISDHVAQFSEFLSKVKNALLQAKEQLKQKTSEQTSETPSVAKKPKPLLETEGPKWWLAGQSATPRRRR